MMEEALPGLSHCHRPSLLKPWVKANLSFLQLLLSGVGHMSSVLGTDFRHTWSFLASTALTAVAIGITSATKAGRRAEVGLEPSSQAHFHQEAIVTLELLPRLPFMFRGQNGIT
jgi:hypothetical protein